MKHDFDCLVDRRGTECTKWDGAMRTHNDEDIIPMWVADMDFRSPPEIVGSLQKRAAHGVFGYTARSEALDRTVIRWLQQRHGWGVDKEWLTYLPGVVSGIRVAVHAFTDPGDGVIVQCPVYSPFFNAVSAASREVLVNQLAVDDGAYGIDFTGLAELLKNPRARMLILCSPHNPVGRVWTRDELQRLADMCREAQVAIVSDEIHCDIVYRGFPHIPISSLPSAEQSAVTLMSASKTFNLSGLANAFAVIPNNDLRTRFNETRQRLGGGHTNIFGLVATEAAFEHGAEWLDQLLAYLEANLDLVDAYLREAMTAIRLTRAQGTYLAWLDCRATGLSDSELHDLMLKKARVLLTGGSIFGQGGSGFLRLNFGCPRPLLLQGLERMGQALASLR